MELLPAIDLRKGRAVRLVQGDDARATVYDDPLAVLERYHAAGAARVHVVDLDAALGEPPQRRLVERLARLAADSGGLELQLGGGLRDRESLAWAFHAGCGRAVVGSLAVREPELFAALAREHPGRLVPALDAAGGEVRLAGWTEGSGRRIEDACAGLQGLPCPAVLVTDIERDGTLAGPNLELARRAARVSGLPALLSGGVRSLADLEAARQAPEVAGAVVGRALYEGVFTLEEALAVCAGGAA